MIDDKLYVHMTPTAGTNSAMSPAAGPGLPSMVFKKSKPATGSMAIRRSKSATAVSGAIRIRPPKVPTLLRPSIPTTVLTTTDFLQQSNKTSSAVSATKKKVRIVTPDEMPPTPPATHSFPTVEDDSQQINPHNKHHQASRANRQVLGSDAPPPSNKATPAVSLFTGNPTIPSLQRKDIDPISEEVFTGEPFDKHGITPVLAKQLVKVGCTQMTVVQQRGIPHVMAGRDVLIKSQTGSGKTLTYAVPIIDALMMMSPPVQRSDGVMAVIIVPTRELAQQTFDWIDKLCKSCIYIVAGFLRGGENKNSEKARLKKGVNILVATPGRLLDHIGTTERLKLNGVKYLVLDEADRMMDMGYEKSIASIIDAISDAKIYGDDRRIKAAKDAREERRNAFGKRPATADGATNNNKKQKKNAAYLKKQMKRMRGEEVEESEEEDEETEIVDEEAINDSIEETINEADKTNNQEEEDSDSEDERPNEDIDDVADVAEDTSSSRPVISIKSSSDVPTISNDVAKTSPARYQTVMLSATLNEQVQRLAGLNLHNPEVIDVSGAGSAALSASRIAMPKLKSNMYMVVPPKLRLVTLAAFILSKCMYGTLKKMLIFMATQDMVDFHTELFQRVLARYGTVPKEEVKVSALESEADQLLDNIGSGTKKKKKVQEVKPKEPEIELEPLFDFMQLRGNMSQEDRSKVFKKFKEASSGILLCTDVASRGLDLPAVTWIVQYTAPCYVTDFVHRVGRTSRADTMGSAMLMLAPSEIDFVYKLDEQHIILKETPYRETLRAFTQAPRRRDPTFQIPRSVEEGATTLQSRVEKLLLSDQDIKKMATDAYLSFIRAYATYPRETKDIFNYKGLHQGHYAKSFALRDAPSALGAGAASKAQAVHRSKKEMKDRKEKIKRSGVSAQKRGAIPSMASISEFDSGLDDLAALLSKKKMEQTKRHNHIKTNKGGVNNRTTKQSLGKQKSKSKLKKKTTSSSGKKSSMKK